jgi:acyl-CoA dehydrogenase
VPDRSYLGWPFFEDRHRTLAAELSAWAAKHAGAHGRDADVDEICRGFVRELGRAGFLALTVPASAGGTYATLEVRSLALAREILAYHDGLADFSFVMQGLGSGPISLFGTPEQQRRWLPGVARGEKIAALGMSEPDAGSDVGNISTSAVADGDGYVLNGVKTWISNGGIADQYSVIARVGDTSGTRGLACFVVEAGTPGFTVPGRIDVIAPHPLGVLRFEDCRVPKQNLIGEPGQGFKIAMANLDVFRSTVAAAALGFARRALDEALARVHDRKVFGQKLADYQLTQAKIADMATEIDASALLTYRAAWTKDQGAARVTREASMAKMYATEAAQRVIDAAVQLWGGLGVTVGQTVESLYREIRALRIYEGTTEINKLVIAGQTYAAYSDREPKR